MEQRVNHTVITVTKRILTALSGLFRRLSGKPRPPGGIPGPVETENGPITASWPEAWAERIRHAQNPVWFRYTVREGLTFRQFPLRSHPAPAGNTVAQPDNGDRSPIAVHAGPSSRPETVNTGIGESTRPNWETFPRRYDPATRQWLSPEREKSPGTVTPTTQRQPATEHPDPMGEFILQSRPQEIGDEESLQSSPPGEPEGRNLPRHRGEQDTGLTDTAPRAFPEKRKREPSPTGIVRERIMTVPFPEAPAERIQWPHLTTPHPPGDRITPVPVEISNKPFPVPPIREPIREPLPSTSIRPLKFKDFPISVATGTRRSHKTDRTVETDEPEQPWPDLEDFEPRTEKRLSGYGLDSRERIERLKREQKGDLWSVSRF